MLGECGVDQSVLELVNIIILNSNIIVKDENITYNSGSYILVY